MGRVSGREIVTMTLVMGVLVVAIADPNFRPYLADLAKFGVGAYFGQLMPRTGDSRTGDSL